jgi:tetratricopeptide (TPR) repeat protein
VYVPADTPAAQPPFDFLTRHFDGSTDLPTDPDFHKGQARAAFEVAFWLVQRGAIEAARPLVLHAIGVARNYRDERPDDPYAWRLLALLESVREPDMAGDGAPIRRYLHPFDAVFDLSPARAAALGRDALALNPDDLKVGLSLASTFMARGLDDAALPLFDHLATYNPAHQTVSVTADTQAAARDQTQAIRSRLGPEPPAAWQNRDELTRNLDARLQRGWVRSAAEFLEHAYPPAARTWPVADRIATLWLHLGEAARAREIWAAAVNPPRPALQSSRIAAAHYAQDDFDNARTAYRAAIAAEPDLFEAHYGLACLERDAGHAPTALASATRAVETAPNPEARRAAQQIARLVPSFPAPPESTVKDR